MIERPFFYRETSNIRVTVRPAYLQAQSQPFLNRYVFVYFIRIENVGKKRAQLLSRRWLIHDSIGEDQQVEGEGVVGQQPILGPGEVHEYNSFCILKSPQGYMEGAYHFIGSDDVLFDVEIPRFYLQAQEQ
ncbi:MAG TPA: Co2+/Mg2+ efflux protein ApaG [Roseiflexaceae bacterium]|jgi:ApaG protein|nr:Co2+/Mg2+ efflux protein ApaG [Roseiflexaceae bacterium]